MYIHPLQLYNLKITLHIFLFHGQNQDILIWREVWFIEITLLCRVKYYYRLLLIAHNLYRVGFTLSTVHKISASRFFCNELKDGNSQDALNFLTYMTVLTENVLSALGLTCTTLNEIKTRTTSCVRDFRLGNESWYQGISYICESRRSLWRAKFRTKKVLSVT